MSILGSGEILVLHVVSKIKDGITTRFVCVSLQVIITLNSPVACRLGGFSKDLSNIQTLHAHRGTNECFVLHVSIK